MVAKQQWNTSGISIIQTIIIENIFRLSIYCVLMQGVEIIDVKLLKPTSSGARRVGLQ